MRVAILVLLVALTYDQFNLSEAKVSEDCLWGRESPEKCCKEAPEGLSPHLANPEECSSFYLCKNKFPFLWSCLPGQIWSVADQKCMDTENTDVCPQKVTFKRTIRKVSEDCLWGRESAEKCCKEAPEGLSPHLANPKECSSFYLCKNKLPLLWPCLPGQIWSVPDQKCIDSENTNECPQKVSVTRMVKKASEDCLWGRESAEKCCKVAPEGLSPHLANPKECSSFFLCKNKLPLIFPCLPGQIWSVPDQKCKFSENTDVCPQKATFTRMVRKVSEDCLWGRESAEKCCKEAPEGLSPHLANPKECSSFYLCKNKLPLLWPCLPGQIWSVPDQKCMDSETPDQCEQLQ